MAAWLFLYEESMVTVWCTAQIILVPTRARATRVTFTSTSLWLKGIWVGPCVKMKMFIISMESLPTTSKETWWCWKSRNTNVCIDGYARGRLGSMSFGTRVWDSISHTLSGDRVLFAARRYNTLVQRRAHKRVPQSARELLRDLPASNSRKTSNGHRGRLSVGDME